MVMRLVVLLLLPWRITRLCSNAGQEAQCVLQDGRPGWKWPEKRQEYRGRAAWQVEAEEEKITLSFLHHLSLNDDTPDGASTLG